MTNHNVSSSTDRKRHWVTAGTVLTGVAAAAAMAFGWHSTRAEASAPAAPEAAAIPVSVAKVETHEVATWEEFSGRLEAIQRVELRSRVAGTVQSVHFREGALVKQGELLVTIDPAPFAAEVDRAQAQELASQARLAYTRSEHERASRLWDERAIAQRELDERANALREADANLRAAKAALQSARLNLGYTQIRAPIAGRIGKLEVTAGNLVAAGPGSPLLATLVSVSPIYASFDADEQIVLKALRGLPAGDSSRTHLKDIPVQMGVGGDAPGDALAGHLQLIDNQVDARSGTLRVRAVFANEDGRLIPGQFARLRMGQPEPQKLLLINERAVGTDQSKRYVMVVGEDNKAAYREVLLGNPSGGLRAVTRGLKAGERIVVNGLQRIRPGASVAPTLVPMDSKSELLAKQAAATAS